LRIQSSSPIPGLNPSGNTGSSDARPLRIVLGRLPSRVDRILHAGHLVHSAETEDSGTPRLVVHEFLEGAYYRVRYADDTVFLVRGDGGAVWSTWSPPLTLEDTATYLLGPIMAFVLRLRGLVSLHAGVVAFEHGAIAVMGAPGSGKSTTMAALALEGFAVLTDDLAPLEDRDGSFFVRPTYPYLRLWGDSAATLFGSAGALPLLTPNWDKRYFDTSNARAFESEPHELRGIFVLRERESSDAPRLTVPTPRESLIALLGNIHGGYLPPKALQDRTLALVARLAARVPVRYITPHAEPARLPALTSMIARESAKFAA
jgi:hypothetical protein